MEKKFHIHLVSDATGETLNAIVNAALAQFEGVDVQVHSYALVRSEHQLNRSIDHIAISPGLVFFTLVNPRLREMLLARCGSLNIACVDVMDQTGSRDLKLWFSDGTNYPGQGDIRGRQDRLAASLAAIYARLGTDQRVVDVDRGAGRGLELHRRRLLAQRDLERHQRPLDGGHLAILAGESVLRRDFSMAVKAWIMNAGAAAIFLLIGLVLYSDLSKTALGRFLP